MIWGFTNQNKGQVQLRHRAQCRQAKYDSEYIICNLVYGLAINAIVGKILQYEQFAMAMRYVTTLGWEETRLLIGCVTPSPDWAVNKRGRRRDLGFSQRTDFGWRRRRAFFGLLGRGRCIHHIAPSEETHTPMPSLGIHQPANVPSLDINTKNCSKPVSKYQTPFWEQMKNLHCILFEKLSANGIRAT